MVGDCVDTIREPISDGLRRKVLSRDRYTCRYCGAKGERRILGIIPAGEVRLEVDHVYPVSKGGDNSPGNLVAACFKCNRTKGDAVGVWPRPLGYFDRRRAQAVKVLYGLAWLSFVAVLAGVLYILAQVGAAAFGGPADIGALAVFGGLGLLAAGWLAGMGAGVRAIQRVHKRGGNQDR